MLSGYTLRDAKAVDKRVALRFVHRDSGELNLTVDHVIAGTGYVVELKRLPFMDDGLRAEIRQEATSPKLSGNFESSVPGLYFVGVASAGTFGPLTRFAHGAGFTARKISAHLRRTQSKEIVVEEFSGAQP
jgi:hypothetical protein